MRLRYNPLEDLSGLKAIISIKPKHAAWIYNGRKKFEFRKKVLRRLQTGDILVIYESAPIQQITGYFIVKSVIIEEVEKLWEHTKEGAGMSYFEYSQYYDGRTRGIAIPIGPSLKLPEPIDPYARFRNFRAPPSFRYIPLHLKRFWIRLLSGRYRF